MTDFTPTEAARIARGVYGLRDETASELARKHMDLGSEGMFAVDDRSRFVGRSGGLIVCKRLTGFGYIAAGVGRRQGEVLIATRGTDMLLDWLSNFNIGVQIGPGGHLVHAGFHEVWKSFSADIAEFLRGRNPSVIHCVGHSLGGALANLNADYLSSLGVGSVRLYTFGAPRAGMAPFGRSLTRRVGAERMYRVHHRSDIVPMTPLFPFQHAPGLGGTYELTGLHSGLISKKAHSMVNSYLPGVDELSWAALARRGQGAASDAHTRSWLDEVAAGGGGILPFGARTLQMIGCALVWLLRQVRDVLLGAVGIAFTVGMTALDELAWMISEAAQVSIEASAYVGTIIAAIFRFLGRTVMVGVSMTMAFIRWVLDLLYSSLSSVARRALSVLD